MSLVSEALKKAEREGAAREAREKGLPAPLETPTQPYRARRGQRPGHKLIPLFVLLGGAAAVAIAVFLARPATEREAAQPFSTDVPPPATAPPSASEPIPTTEPPLPLPRTTSSSPSREPSASEPARPAPSAPPARAGAREYVRRVELSDGTKLELGGIAYSEAAPFAYLNGKLLAVGERTAGYTLLRIERDRVVVRGETGDLTIRLKPE